MHDYTKYFLEKPGFNRLILAIYQKYQSLGTFSGTIKLSDLTIEESETLSKFLGHKINIHDDLTISLKKFLTIMQNSKFTDFDITIFISEYLNTNLITNKEINYQKQLVEQNYYKSILTNKNSLGTDWLKKTIESRKSPYNIIHKRYLKNKNDLQKELKNLILLIDNLPSESTLLPIFSSTYTANPHYLDIDNKECILFLYYLANLKNKEFPTTREEKINLLKENNIVIDNYSNFVLTYNLISNKSYINDFAKNKESLILNIQNILTTEKFDSFNKKVFILENPSILTKIINDNIKATIVIANGFSNSSVYLLLEKLLESGNTLYYNGDFDPEGLLIASKFKEKYPEQLNLFCYSLADYKATSANSNISQKRLNILNNIKTPELTEIKNIICQTKKAGYQENNQENILNFIKLKA